MDSKLCGVNWCGITVVSTVATDPWLYYGPRCGVLGPIIGPHQLLDLICLFTLVYR